VAIVYEFESVLLLEEHFDKHGMLFPSAHTEQDYLESINRFLAPGCTPPRRCCTRANGDTLLYERRTQRFAIFNEEWAIVRTVHKRSARSAEELFMRYCVSHE